MKLTNAIIIGTGCMLLAFTACKKTKNEDQMRNDLLGKWIETNEATDKNGNDQMDTDEVVAPQLYQTFNLNYYADGTFNILQNTSIAGEKNWSLEFNNTYLKTSDKGSGTNTVYQHIDNITASTMTLKDTTQGMVRWYRFTKQ